MDDFHRYIYFYTLDATGVHTTSGYTLPITPFTFIPVFDDGDSVDYSDRHILWDFGDGTTSQSITATHHYKLPGWYTVKCYVLGKEGEGYTDSFSQNLAVHDYITDTLVVSGLISKTESGTNQNPFEVFRFNSWQTYQALSATGYTINLHAYGNNAPLLDVEKYKKDKWGHLKPSSRFEAYVYNNMTRKYEKVPVNSIQTDVETNKEIYVRLFNNKLELCDKSYDGACFAGTSGSKMFYYVDDLPKNVVDMEDEQAVTTFVSFDTSKFEDIDSIYKNYENTEYSVLNKVYDSTAFSVIIEKLRSDHLVITSNGIDDDNDGNLIKDFYISTQKFAGQKIPFVVRVKDDLDFTAKHNPVFKLSNNSDIKVGEIHLQLLDEYGNKVPDTTFYSSMGVLSSEKYGGYFKGYLICNTPTKNVTINAAVIPTINSNYFCETTYSILSEPQSNEIHSLRYQRDTFDRTKRHLVDTLKDVDGLNGIYSSCVVSKRLINGTTNHVIWLVDADKERILKYNPLNNNITYDSFVLPSNSSPSNISCDKDGNAWVTLYDSISTVRINNLSNMIDMVIKPSIANNVIVDYENTVTPASVDVDLTNNIWISYSNQLSSFVEKYDRDGNFIFNRKLTPNYQSTEIITDLNSNVWGIAKDLVTTTKDLSSKLDKIYKIDANNNGITYYNVNGSLWNLTLDVSGNIWVTKNKNEVAIIDNSTNQISSFVIPTNSLNTSDNYISDLEGITCTTDNTILVVDNTNKKLHHFKSNVKRYGFDVGSFDLTPATKVSTMTIQDKLNGYGDWNGFRYINKFQNAFNDNPAPIYGSSNSFNIYPSSHGEYEIRKVNENFDMKRQMMAYRFQDYLLESPDLFEKMIGTIVGDISGKPNELGKVVYEKIANFTNNIHNVDTCNIKALESMYKMLDEPLYTFNNTAYNLPAELSRLINIFTIKYSKLRGSRDKFDSNFNNKGFDNDSLRANNRPVNFGINRGKELNFFTSILTSGVPIVAYEKFSENYRTINTHMLSSEYGNVNFIDPITKTYALSTYHPNWAWGLTLPEEYGNDQIPLLYSFYEYISGYTDIQNEGVINWQDPYNTIPYDMNSKEQWGIIKDKLIYYSLAKGLGIIK